VLANKPVLFSPENGEVCASLSAGQERLVREIISRAADKWSLWTLSQLATNGPLRFSRLLERVTGISQKSLTVTLRQLERDGLVTRTVTVRSPIRVDCEATPLCIDLIRQIDPIWTWAARNHDALASRAPAMLRSDCPSRGPGYNSARHLEVID
jgi:DNA-binding HxlR family transcriptional regulator